MRNCLPGAVMALAVKVLLTLTLPSKYPAVPPIADLYTPMPSAAPPRLSPYTPYPVLLMPITPALPVPGALLVPMTPWSSFESPQTPACPLSVRLRLDGLTSCPYTPYPFGLLLTPAVALYPAAEL